METLKILLPFILKGSVAAIVLGIGLDATRDDILYLAQRPGRLGRAFLAISIIVPLAAVIVMRALPLSLPAKAGVILMSLAPVPPFVPFKALQAGGRKDYVYGLYATFAVLAVIIVPITVGVLNHLYGMDVELSEQTLLTTVLTTVLGPLIVGMVIRSGWPDLAKRAAPLVGRLGLLLLVAAGVLILARAWRPVLDMVGNGMVLGIAAIVACAIIGGHFLGGPDPRDRTVLATTAATRHPGIAMMIANTNSPDKKVDAAIMLFLLVAVVLVTLYQAIMKRRAGRPRSL